MDPDAPDGPIHYFSEYCTNQKMPLRHPSADGFWVWRWDCLRQTPDWDCLKEPYESQLVFLEKFSESYIDYENRAFDAAVLRDVGLSSGCLQGKFEASDTSDIVFFL